MIICLPVHYPITLILIRHGPCLSCTSPATERLCGPEGVEMRFLPPP
jgi:hypothetical protein